MKEVLPLVIICSVGIALCLGYLVFLAVRALRRRFGLKKRNRFEIDENSLTIKL